jgi:hemolysin activation/secretion protein
MTITGAGAATFSERATPGRGIVIILLALAGTLARAQSPSLTTTAHAAPVLAAVVIEGSSAYGAPQLFGAYRDQLGQPVSVEGARQIVGALQAMYQRDGFVKPEIELDDALTDRGVIRVRVYEARISRVTLDGDAGRHRQALENIGARLQAAAPLRREDLSQALAAMRRIAGLAITASTRRDPSDRNAIELVVKPNYSRVEGMVRMNNRGTDEVGPGFLLGQLSVNGPFGGREKLGLLFAAAAEHQEFLGAGLFFDTAFESGTRANLLLFKSRSAPRETPVDFAYEYERERAALRVSHALRQDAGASLILGAALEAEDLFIERRGTGLREVRLREDRLRVVETGIRAGWRTLDAVQFSASFALRKGMDAFGARLDAPYLDHDPRRVDFLLTQLSGGAYRRFSTDWSLRFDVLAQYTADVLPDSERFKIGGDRLGRGFEVAEIAGDRGVGGKLELRRNLLATDGPLGRIAAYGFYDVGAAWKRDRPGRESATTAGTGLAIQGSMLTGYLELAAPLTGTDIEGKRNPSVFAELSYRF